MRLVARKAFSDLESILMSASRDTFSRFLFVRLVVYFIRILRDVRS